MLRLSFAIPSIVGLHHHRIYVSVFTSRRRRGATDRTYQGRPLPDSALEVATTTPANSTRISSHWHSGISPGFDLLNESYIIAAQFFPRGVQSP